MKAPQNGFKRGFFERYFKKNGKIFGKYQKYSYLCTRKSWEITVR